MALDQHQDLVAVGGAAGVVSVARNRITVSLLTAGAVKIATYGSRVFSDTAGPSSCVHWIDCTPVPAAGQARTDALPPMRTEWLARSVNNDVPAATSSATLCVRAVPDGSVKATSNA